MKVLHAISGIAAHAGGPATALAALCTAQRRAGIDARIVATYEEESDRAAAEVIRASGVPVDHVGPVSQLLARHPDIVSTLRRLLGEVDLLHSHGLWEEIQHQAPHQARRMGVPYLISPHGMLTPWSLAQGALKKRLYMLWRMRADLNHAQAIHYTGKVEAEGGRALGLQPKSLLVPLGVDLNEFQPLPPRGTFRARYPQLKDHPVVMYLGRLYNHKGLELLIPAMARMSLRDAMLAIVGPDQDGFEAKLRGLVSEHGLNDRVIFTGLVRGRERIEALVDADVFALPSFHENFGVAAIEALAAGCPVIVSDQVGVADQIADDSVASVVPTQVEPLATELDRWLKNPELREQARRRAPALVRERFDWDKIAARWMGHYRVILDDYRKSV